MVKINVFFDYEFGLGIKPKLEVLDSTKDAIVAAAIKGLVNPSTPVKIALTRLKKNEGLIDPNAIEKVDLNGIGDDALSGYNNYHAFVEKIEPTA